MGLIADIQNEALQADAPLGPMLLKLRLLAARLDSKPLEDWVKYESEGYPKEVPVPEYRKLSVHYRGSFAGPFGGGVNNVAIPSHLIREYAGESWLESEIRSSVSAIDDLLASRTSGGQIQTTNASNLVLLLKGKVFPDYEPISVVGVVSGSEMAAIQHAVRSKVLELTIELERQIPESLNVSVASTSAVTDEAESERVSTLSSKIIYGNNIEINNAGNSGNINFSIKMGDVEDLTRALADGGLPQTEAKQIADIISSEQPASPQEPLGKRAQKWLVDNLKKAADGTWNIGTTVATNLITAAAMQYYGLK